MSIFAGPAIRASISWSSICERKTEEKRLVSAPAYPRACLLFHDVMYGWPLIACGCLPNDV